MRGIQILGLSSTTTTERDELVKDLENWFEDHQQMCRLITTCLESDTDEAASGLDRLRASVDSGQRLLGRLKVSVQSTGATNNPTRPSASAGIPLSGMNRFDETKQRSVVSSGMSRSVSTGLGLSSAQQAQHPNGQGGVTLAADAQRILPSRTYLKKSGS